MADLKSLITQMLDDVSKGKHKKKKAKKRKVPTLAELTTPDKRIINPWHDEAIVLIITTYKCRSCANEVTAWSPHLYIERSQTTRGKLTRIIERLPHCDPAVAYTTLPRRIEHREELTCQCHLCFGELPTGFNHQGIQLQLPLIYHNEKEPNHDTSFPSTAQR